MYIPVTIVTLALLTVATLLLRIFWLRLPAGFGKFLIRAAIVLIVVHGLSTATKWSTTSERINVLINWLAVAGYELLIWLFSRLSPRWITIPSAIILLIPLFASSVLFPLSHLFEPGLGPSVTIDDHFFYQITPWPNTGDGTAGVDVIVYYHPSFAPFLRHRVAAIPFNERECVPAAAFAVLSPNKKMAIGRCPRSSLPSTEFVERDLPVN
jgi:hypothetical protein